MVLSREADRIVGKLETGPLHRKGTPDVTGHAT